MLHTIGDMSTRGQSLCRLPESFEVYNPKDRRVAITPTVSRRLLDYMEMVILWEQMDSSILYKNLCIIRYYETCFLVDIHVQELKLTK